MNTAEKSGFKALREELRGREIDIIASQMIAGKKTRDEIADMLIRSAAKSKTASVVDAPIYKVCFWLNRNRDSLNGFENRNKLAKSIHEDTGIPLYTIVSMLQGQPFNIPDHLKTSSRKILDIPLRRPVTHPPQPSPSIQEIKHEAREIRAEEIKLPSGVRELSIRSGNFELLLKF